MLLLLLFLLLLFLCVGLCSSSLQPELCNAFKWQTQNFPRNVTGSIQGRSGLASRESVKLWLLHLLETCVLWRKSKDILSGEKMYVEGVTEVLQSKSSSILEVVPLGFKSASQMNSRWTPVGYLVGTNTFYSCISFIFISVRKMWPIKLQLPSGS